MTEFVKIFKKVNGMQQLKQYAKAHVLGFALVETLLLGFSRKSLEIVRLAVNNRVYKKLKKQNEKFINKYMSQNKEKKMSHEHRNVIWTIWLQGIEQAPEIVKQCYDSICKNNPDKEIIVITDNNYRDYVDFPKYIVEKYQKGIISKVHFADLLRIELLAKYGGTWLDGTVFCSANPYELGKGYILDSDLFLFQTLKPGLDGHVTSISSWLMTASSNQPVILLVRALLHNYWYTHDYAVDYFILHDFFQMAIEAYPDEWGKVIPYSNSTPHILLLRLFETYDEEVWNGIKEQTPFHKLSYKFDSELLKNKNTYYDKVVRG